MQKFIRKPDLRLSGDEDLLGFEKDFAAVDAWFYEEGFVRDKETAMPNGAKDGDVLEEMGYIHPEKQEPFYEIHTRLFSTESSAYGYLNRIFRDKPRIHPKRKCRGRASFYLRRNASSFLSSVTASSTFFTAVSGSVRSGDMVQMIRIWKKIDWEMFWQSVKSII